MEWDGDFASRNACRVILSGDTRQHHSVERGDALRVLERVGAVSQVVLTKIFRQLDPVQRAAIYDLSEGETARGFDNKTNLKWLEGRGTFAGLCPRDPRALREAMKDEHFAQAQRRRAQTEARVAIFKNEFLGRPMRSEGFENRALQVAWGVLTPF